LLTKRDTFVQKEEFMQLVYSAIGPSRPGAREGPVIRLPIPAILKPQPLWTGKQVPFPLAYLFMKRKVQLCVLFYPKVFLCV
jgi:hypothetical protein